MTRLILCVLVSVLSLSQAHPNNDEYIQIGSHVLQLGSPTTLHLTSGRGSTMALLDRSTDAPTAKLTHKTRTGPSRSHETEMELTNPNIARRHLRSYLFDDVECLDISIEALECVTQVITDCIFMNGTHWYGGAEMHQQLWPLEKLSMAMGPYVASDNSAFPYGAVQERYFYTSSGIGIWIEEDIPLYVSINATGDHMLCLQSKYDNSIYRNFDNSLPVLNYTMCVEKDVMSIHTFMSERYISKPTGTPNEDVLRKPIWSTWAQYKKNINQSLVLEFVDNILKNNLTISNLEIDEKWMPNFGDLVFDTMKFPDAKGMVDEIHRKGMAVTTWVPPFVNLESSNFNYAASKGYLMNDMSGGRPALVSWWEAKWAGIIDFTNSEATEWFQGNLANLRTTYGIDSYKFDAGDANYLPSDYKPAKEFRNPDVFARSYAEAVARVDNSSRRHEVRTGRKTQSLPAMTRMIDKNSDWTYEQGLKTIVTSGLVFSSIGYSFILPDMVGGNGYGGIWPDAELFIRWTQANALMPTIQFAITPWTYNNSTLMSIIQQMLTLREKYGDTIVSLARESVTTGAPIMRPLWWIAPTDESALTVDDEFLLGNDLLVAPVLNPGVKSRKIYLPVGQWRDEIHGTTVSGGQWIDYPVRLEDLPHFTKLS